MTSIHTNAGAIAALQTLRSIDSDVTATQGRISSGLRVQTAADNAAYWSISTTMRSDNRALSTVHDALGLGAATVDTAYSGMEAVADVLSEIKAKIIAAREPGIDKAKIQKELDQLKDGIVSIATSASFGGVNWLSTDIADDLANVSTFRAELVSSFVRSSSGNVSVNTIDIDLAGISLLNAGGGGALQTDIRSLGTIGGFRGTALAPAGYGGYEQYGFTGPVTFNSSDYITFDVILDAGAHSSGTTYSVTIDKSVIDAALGTTTGIIPGPEEMADVLRQAFTFSGVPASAGFNPNPSWTVFSIHTQEATGHPGSSVDIGTIATSFAAGFALGLENTPWQINSNDYAQGSFSFTGPFRVHNDVTFSFDIQVDGDIPLTITVDRSLVDSALGTTDGVVGSAAAMATVLDAALQNHGLNASSSGSSVYFDVDQTLYPDAGSRSYFRLSNIQDNIGTLPDFDLLDIDITNPTNDLDRYLYGIEGMMEKVVTRAADLGAIKSRIDMQTEFASSMIGTINKGIGRLVDADLNEESTRLKALQTQEQLSVQALQIANSNSENIMALFR
ncbi:flagellin [Pararhizobium sp. O133]|uniref:flagellin N-terminal helical domain-containing protein n=1 Tax=Pararhizobium sp. O133 TaxID=3449278 RepID=UPI003F6864F0